MKKLLVLGGSGLIGNALLKNSENKFDILTTFNKNPITIESLRSFHYSLPNDLNKLEDLLTNEKPDILVNTMGYSNIDFCESNKNDADILHVEITEKISNICENLEIKQIFLSSDFIFDGEDGPYKEEDKPNPLSYYGLSKLKSENIVKESDCNWTILRTIIVFGVGENLSKSNIVLWAKGALEKDEPLNIIDDQFRAPTLAEDLADACILAATKKAYGIFNASGKDIMSIYEIVERIAKHYRNTTKNLNKISTATLNQKAGRPPKTGFILDKAINELGYNPHSFEECLTIIDEQLKKIIKT